MKSFIVLSVLAIFLSLIALPSWSNEKEAMNTKAIFETKCSICHGTDRAKSKKKTQEAWTKTVLRMQGKKEGLIGNDDAKMIIDYLAMNYGK